MIIIHKIKIQEISWIFLYIDFSKNINMFYKNTINMAKKEVKEQENTEVKETKKEQEIVVKQKETLEEMSVFDLDNLLISTEHLIKYYTNLAMANDGLYTHDTKELYANARKKIQALENKKTEILYELEKRILV